MESKDYLSEKLRLKELADEDRYFGERDREILTRWKAQKIAEHEGALREQSRGRCPQCGQPMRARLIQGETVLECLPCHGIWTHPNTHATLGSNREWLITFLRGLGGWRTHADTQIERSRHA